MATYGSIPGVRITTGTGTVAGVTIGREQYLTLIGVGGSGGSAPANEVVNLGGREDVATKFGEASAVANAYSRALANGANPNFINAVKVGVSENSELTTTFSGSLPDSPVVPSEQHFTVYDSNGDEIDHEFRYEDPLDVPTTEDILYIDPRSGNYEIETSDTEIEIDYAVPAWNDAINAASGAISEAEFGVIAPLTYVSSAITQLQSVISGMRSDMKMAVGVVPASPNATDGGPFIDVGSYDQTMSDDTIFAAGPTALDPIETTAERGVGALSAVAGRFAGNATTEPVYDTTLTLSGLSQDISRADVNTLRDKYVIPLRDTGTVRMKDNRSTYDQETDGGWERDYFRRRIVDLTTVTLFQIARRQIGGILDDDTIDDVADALNAEMTELVEDGLLEPDGQTIDVYRQDDRTIGIDAEITPYGVAKGADVQLDVIA